MIRFAALVLMALLVAPAQASAPTEVCPAQPLVSRGMVYEPGGMILTAFDRSGLWVVDVDRRSRYPLDDTRLCGSNCHLSADARTVTYLDGEEEQVRRMTLDGVTRETVFDDTANDVIYWSSDSLLVYTAAQRAYLYPTSGSVTELDISRVVSIQPGGLWALALDYRDGVFHRQLINLALRNAPDSPTVEIGPEARYFNAATWSPDGSAVAAVVPVTHGGRTGGEIVIAEPETKESRQVTDLLDTVGPLRIGGVGTAGLSWSPDGRYVAFWGASLTGDDPEADVETASLFVYDRETDETRSYCGAIVEDITPEPPRLIWSPDASKIAFAGNLPDNAGGWLLLALDVETGVFTELTNGVAPMLTRPNVLVWGRRP